MMIKMSNNNSRIQLKKISKFRRIMQVSIIFLGIILLATGGYVYYLYDSVKDTAADMHEDVELNSPKPKVNKGEESISILLMGVDERENDNGRADSLVVMTLNPSTKSMQMVSIPRDTRTTIVGKGIEDKINHSYAFGGTKMAVDTVEEFTGISINYFAKVNMEGLSDLVDSVGGITVNNPLDWHDDRYYKKGYHYKKGEITLDGPQALGYVRMRYQDPRGDFGRADRQRQVIRAIIDKGASVSSVTRVDNILESIGSNAKTNMTFDEMKDILANYKDCRNNVESYLVQGKGSTINGGYYYVVSDEERTKVNNMLTDHLTAAK
jgi:LCP family protein required for cell wall assembly